MSLKEFLKITKGKVLLTIVFVLISVVAFVMGLGCVLSTGGYGDCRLLETITYILVWPVIFLVFPLDSMGMDHTNPILCGILVTGGIIIQIFYLYVISSLIIWITNKLKR
ncbi:hypothetical protein KAJ38_02965 [Candidatus Pacearchaeota archaeon]|nr:hypothetical protein [Candidatus Pacearchaeota archaeon]